MASARHRFGLQLRQKAGRTAAAEVEHRQLDRIQRVFDQQPQLGVALGRQAAAEKQRVRVFLAACQQQEIMRAGADGQVGIDGIGARAASRKTGIAPFEIKGDARIGDP